LKPSARPLLARAFALLSDREYFRRRCVCPRWSVHRALALAGEAAESASARPLDRTRIVAFANLTARVTRVTFAAALGALHARSSPSREALAASRRRFSCCACATASTKAGKNSGKTLEIQRSTPIIRASFTFFAAR